jgi:transcriptional regulator with XRE-family HTH domain
VPDHSSSRIGRRRLATELRRQRERVNLTGDEAAARLGWSGSKVSRIELNRTEVKLADLDKLLDLYSVTGALRDALEALARAPRARGWWETYSDVVQPEYAAYIELEAEAEKAECWSTMVVHGLLQTEDYARASMESHVQWLGVVPGGMIRRRLEVRRTRQRLVTDGTLALSVVLDESVLLRQVGEREVMRAQLERLAELSALDNVDLRVLPLAGRHPFGTGSFNLLSFAPLLGIDPPADVIYVELLTRNEVYAEDEEEAREYQLAFRQLLADSLDQSQTRELITRVMRDVWS